MFGALAAGLAVVELWALLALNGLLACTAEKLLNYNINKLLYSAYSGQNSVLTQLLNQIICQSFCQKTEKPTIIT